MDINFIIFLGYVVLIVFSCYFFGKKLNNWINKGEPGAKYYTRLTMYIVIISLFSVLIIMGNSIITVYMIKDTKDALEAQARGIAPIRPRIIPKLINEDYNHFFPSFRLVNLVRQDENWTFGVDKEEIRFYVRNDGQGNPGNVNFYLRDNDGLFQADNINKVIKPFDFEYLEFLVRYKKCYSGKGRERWEQIEKDGCDESLLKTGLMDWILKVDCTACQNERNPQCYSFKICVYNVSQQEDLCKLQWEDEFGELTPLSECPEPWFV